MEDETTILPGLPEFCREVEERSVPIPRKSNLQIIIALRCHWCSKQYPPTELMALSSNQLMCRNCFGHHLVALDVLAKKIIPTECHLCHTPLSVLNDLEPGPTTRMYVINIDHAYAVACGTCKDKYMRKRADLIKGTAYGEELKV